MQEISDGSLRGSCDSARRPENEKSKYELMIEELDRNMKKMTGKTRGMDSALLRQIETDYLDWRILLVKARDGDAISQALIDKEMSDEALYQNYFRLMVLLKTSYHTDKNAFIRYEAEFHRLIGRALSAYEMEIITSDKQFTPLRKMINPRTGEPYPSEGA
jgi:hypothetical protein